LDGTFSRFTPTYNDISNNKLQEIDILLLNAAARNAAEVQPVNLSKKRETILHVPE
jgi:hypothetical protein